MNSTAVKIELCASSLQDALIAQACGADRIELNSALPVGGLTPSMGLIQQVLGQVKLPVIVMIRCRPSGFCYSDHEFEVMCVDIALALQAGAAGIAFGALDEQGEIDVNRCQIVRDMVGDAAFVFHRAFDFVGNQFRALEQLMDLGADRILTSGGAASAFLGRERISELVLRAAGQIPMIAAAGIGPENVTDIVRTTGVNQIHGTFGRNCHDLSVAGSLTLDDLPTDSTEYRQADPQCLKNVVQALKWLEK